MLNCKLWYLLSECLQIIQPYITTNYSYKELNCGCSLRERERERSISVKGEAVSYQEFPFKASAIWFFKRVNFSSLIFISLSLEVVISNIFSSS